MQSRVMSGNVKRLARNVLADLVWETMAPSLRSLLQGGWWIRARTAKSDIWMPEVCVQFWLQTGTRDFMSDSGPPKKRKLVPLQERKMVDRFRIHVRGGEGGAGCTSFRKSRHSDHRVADGGNGGKGGDVILVSSGAVWDLSNLQHHLNGKKGGQGTSKRQVGSRGLDKIVQVPIGIVVHLEMGSIPCLEQPSILPDQSPWEHWRVPAHAEGTLDIEECGGNTEGAILNKRASPCAPHEKDLILQDRDVDTSFKEDMGGGGGDHYRESRADQDEISGDCISDEEDEEEKEDIFELAMRYSVAEFVRPGQSLVVACGGEGGRGNAAVARGKGSQKNLPSLDHEPGLPGSEAILVLELKTIADVGLVGAPNAGKSTLLGAISRAKPAVGHYAFTTLRPNIGKLEYEDFFAMTVADIPGLIKGAHENRGLGHAFLRHIERTKALAYVVDLSAGQGDHKGALPWDQLQELINELEEYQAGLSQRPSLVVANKIDEPGTDVALDELKRRLPQSMPIFPVCAVLEEGVAELRVGLRALVDIRQTWSPSLD